jgi:hypothetical protein
MNQLLLPLSLLCGLILSATAVSLFVVYRAYNLLRELQVCAGIRPASTLTSASADPSVPELRTSIEALAAQIHDLQNHVPAPNAPPALPKPGFNLSKRSQALRMNRRGESSDQIAAALDLPRQEVDLLLKVHRIVLGSI